MEVKIPLFEVAGPVSVGCAVSTLMKSLIV